MFLMSLGPPSCNLTYTLFPYAALFRSVRPLRLDHASQALDGFDDVLAGALGHLERQRRLPVDARKAVGVLEGAAQAGDVAEAHHRVAVDLHRQIGRAHV